MHRWAVKIFSVSSAACDKYDLCGQYPGAGPSGILGSRDFMSAKIPGFLELKSRDLSGYIVTMFWTPHSHAKNRQHWQKYFLLFIRVNPVPKNPGIPGFGKIPSRKIPGLKILIPLGPAYLPTYLTYLPTYLTDLPIYQPDLPDLPDLPTSLTYTYLTNLHTWPSYLTYLPTWPTYQPDLTRPTYLIFLRTHLPVKNFSTDLK